MPDKRPVDDLSIEELEKILIVKKREARQHRLKRMRVTGRVIETHATPLPDDPHTPSVASDDNSEITQAAVPLPKRKVVPQFEDAIDVQDYKRKSNSGRIWQLFIDRSLLLVEVAAVIGLIVLGVALFNGLTLLENETAAAQAAAEAQRRASLPTVAPTPQLTLSNVVLPTGHTFLNNKPVFNFGEIPDNLQNLAVNEIYLPPDLARVPTTDDTPLRVIIPSIDVDNTIVPGVDWNALQLGVGMLQNNALPNNENDNIVLAAHNDIYNELFRDLDQLQVGDTLQIQTATGFYDYVIREQLLVDPDDVHVMDSQGTPMITLISCYPYRVNNKRIVIYADRIN